MTVSKLFSYWIFTVLIGSVIAPLILTLNSGFMNGILELVLIFVVASFITSIPAIIVLYFILLKQNERKKVAKKEKERILMVSHLLCGIFTFVILNAFYSGTGIAPVVIVIFSTYTGIGMLFWFFEFRKNRTIEKSHSSNIIDEGVSDDTF